MIFYWKNAENRYFAKFFGMGLADRFGVLFSG